MIIFNIFVCVNRLNHHIIISLFFNSSQPELELDLQLEVLPHEVCESPGQVHCGRAAAEHGEDALQVEQLQELVVTEKVRNAFCRTAAFV